MDNSGYAGATRRRGLSAGLVFLGVLALLALMLYGTFKSSYNSLVRNDQAVKAAWSEVENDLQRRSDLLPNLVNTVKGIAGQEQKVFGQIADARARIGSAGAGISEDKIRASNELSGALSRLLVISENYPQLRSNENFLGLQAEVAGTENRLSHSREQYNRSVRSYNEASKSFPMVLFVGMTGFKREYPYFEAPAESRQRPNVDFSDTTGPNKT